MVDLNKLLRQATVRRNVVDQLIPMRRDAGHPDYQHVNMEDVHRSTRQVAKTDEPEIPSGLVEFLNAEGEIAEDLSRGRQGGHTRRACLHHERLTQESGPHASANTGRTTGFRCAAQCPSESGERAVPVLHLVAANGCEPNPAVQERLHTTGLLHNTSPSGRRSRFSRRDAQAQTL